jgi:KAP family P-loop domain
MVYRLSTLEIPENDPFKNDALERRPIVNFLVSLIERTGGPFVLALDSPWGTGKTTLVRMLEAELKQKDFSCVYFNAWQVDYVTDPLVALVSSIDRVELGLDGKAEESFKKHMKTVRRVTSLVAKRAAVAAAKVLTVGALDLESEIEDAVTELAGDSVNDIVESFQKESLLLEKFRTELKKAIEQLSAAGKKPTVVFFIDEIDRCRPTFTVELLERIKHLFEIPNILFVLSLDKRQLEASITAIYGQGIDAPEYLRRFIDLEYLIPTVKTKQFVESLFKRFALDEIFVQRTHPDLQSDKSNFINFFASLAEAVPLTLRAQERCLTRLQVVMDQTPIDHYLDPILVALLIVLKAIQPDLLSKLYRGNATAKDVMDYLNGLPGGKNVISGRQGILIEAYLISSDDNYERKEKAMSDLRDQINKQGFSVEAKERASQLLQITQHLTRGMRDISFSHVSRKIDLAAWIKD